MSLEFPWAAFMEAQNQKKQNQQQMNQNIAGLGQAIGGGLEGYAKIAQDQQKKKQWSQTINSLMIDPTINPNMKAMLPMMAQHPELAGQLGPELMKPIQQKAEFMPVPGVLSKDSKPFIFDKFTGKMVEGPMEAKPNAGLGSPMAAERGRQFEVTQQPMNQGPNTQGGASAMVKIGARQGKALIAQPGSPQRTAAASADLVRAITRVAPTDEGLKMANFSGNVVDRWSRLKQQLTADPTIVDNPKIRKEMYDIFDDMDKSAEPFIKNQLDALKQRGYGITQDDYNRNLGLNIKEIPFVESMTSGPSTPPAGFPSAPTGPYKDSGKEARYQAWKRSQGL